MFEAVLPDRVVKAGHLEQAIEDIVQAKAAAKIQSAELYAERVAGLSETKRSILLALADEPTSTFGDGYRAAHALPVSSTLHTALKELQENGIVCTDESGHRIADPFFMRYIRTSPARVF